MEERPVTTLRGVGPRVAELLEKLGVTTVQDLLFHLPNRYEDRTRLSPVGSVRPGELRLIHGRIEASSVRMGRRRSLVSVISDNTGSIAMRLFYFTRQQQLSMERGKWIQCFGEVRHGPKTFEMVHPEYRLLSGPEDVRVEETLTPVYPTTEGIGQKTLRNFCRAALSILEEGIDDLLPRDTETHGETLPSLAEALATLHLPTPDTDVSLLMSGHHPAQQRLALEELIAHHLALRNIKKRRTRQKAPSINSAGDLCESLLSSLPFQLTGAQQRVVDEVLGDLRKATPSMRMVQGDVGSGKTVVAAAAAAQAVEAGYQVAVMAPTELLAEQHWKNFSHWFEPIGVDVAWLAGKLTPGNRKKTQQRMADGSVPVVVGTHALFQPGVEFHHLGLVIVDEQHRFGVEQRLALRDKGHVNGAFPHQIAMTATPIPRSLAMVMYADMDVSAIDELPPGRKTVDTVVVSNTRRDEVSERVRRACADGRQAYWVCPIIDESESLEVEAASDTAVKLKESFPELSVGLIHGRVKAKEKESIMDAFRCGDIQLLVATTVIEVGVDVPQASLMIIENAERLGLSQLHQLRGRVGRGAEQSTCVLMYRQPLGDVAKQRLTALKETHDGFEIARRDLELRGPGEYLGTRQTGLPGFRIADLGRDHALLDRARILADRLVKRRPSAVQPLMRRWLGHSVSYTNA